MASGPALAEEPLQASLQTAVQEATVSETSTAGIWLKIPADEKVMFSGEVNYDKAGIKSTSMMYPAPGLIGLIAAVAAHGAVAGSLRENQKQRLREDANVVLREYESILNGFKYTELATASLELMTSAGKKSMIGAAAQIMPNGTIIESQPQFLMTQDQRAIILDNPISIQASGSATPYRMQIRVVSRDIGEDAPGKAWTDDQGRKLKNESERLFAASLDIALNAMAAAGKEDGAYKTVRFQEGGAEKMERGQLIREDCNSIVFKTLRGGLMSVPPKNDNCADIK